MQPLKRTKYSKNKSTEKQEIATLQSLLNEEGIITDLTRGDDDFPNIDGYLHLLNEDREMTGHLLQVQVKPIRYKKGGFPTSTVKIELLAHAYDSSTPVLLLGVDAQKSEAYWAYLSPESVKGLLAGVNGQKTITLNLPPKNLIKKGVSAYVDEWRRICLHHRNQSNDKIMARLIRKWRKDGVMHQTSVEALETLSDLVFYRTNGGEYPFFEYALSLAPEVYKGDEEAKLRYMNILERVYYYRVAEVLGILLESALDENEKVADKAKHILLEVSKYNVHVLNTIGYGPHRTLVDSLKKFLNREGGRQNQLATDILHNVLASSFEGTSHPDQITITFHRGPLPPNPYLEKIRADAYDLLFGLFSNAEDAKERVGILSAIFYGFHAPDYPFANEEAEQRYFSMVNKEASDIIQRYEKILFSKEGTLSEEYPIVYEIEHQLSWLTVWKRKVPELARLLANLRNTKSDYDFYRLMIGDGHDISMDQGLDVARENRERGVQQYLDSISDKNIAEWIARLSKVAGFSGAFDDERRSWKLHPFRDFLLKIGKEKPEIAASMLESAFKKRGPLYQFAENFLFGLRQSSLPLWDKYAGLVESAASKELAGALLTSFEFHPAANIKENIRTEDVDLLIKIIEAREGFAFLKNEADRAFLYRLIRAMLFTYRADPERCRALIIDILKANPKEASLLLDQISFALWPGARWISFDDWGETELDAIVDALVEVQRFDHNEEQVLLSLGRRNFEAAIAVFDRRLGRESQVKKGLSLDPLRFPSYDAIPHDFTNPDLAQLIRDNPKYKDVLRRWIASITDEDISARFDLSRLISFIGGAAREEVIQELISSGEKEKIEKVLALFPLIDAPDFELCFRIIDATDDEEILSYVSGKMRNVGMMGGAYGDDLYGNGLRSVRDRLRKEGLTNPSKKVKEFSTKMVSELDREIEISAEHNRKQLEQDKIEFEENKLD